MIPIFFQIFHCIYLTYICGKFPCSPSQDMDIHREVAHDYRVIEPDSSIFLYRNLTIISQDIDSNYFLFRQPTSSQVTNWIQPIIKDFNIPLDSLSIRTYVRLVSIQKIDSNYSSIIVSIGNELKIYYYITIDKNGFAIDGVTVSNIRNYSNSNVEYLQDRKIYKHYTETYGYFEENRIHIFTVSGYAKTASIRTNQWEEIYEVVLEIKPNGQIITQDKERRINSSDFYKLFR